jgi:hypothetical protein
MIFKLIYGNHAANGLAIVDTLNLIKHSLEELGHQAHFERNICPGHINIVTEFFTYDFLAHYEKALETAGTQFIIIATEYLTGETFNNFDNLKIEQFTTLNSHYDNLTYWKKRFTTFEIAAKHACAIWHLSEHQVHNYQQRFGQDKVCYLPHAYVASLENPNTVALSDKDVDVIFTGTATPYRMNILNGLANKGLEVKVLEVMTPEYVRASWVSRAKVAINLRQHADWKYPSNSRFYYHLMNHSMLVSEKCEFDCDLSKYVAEVEAEQFIVYVMDLIQRQNYQSKASENVALFKQERPMKPLMAELIQAIPDSKP